MNREFWKGKKVLVTGHTGFKGSWLSLWLQSVGAEVTGYALTPPTTPSLFQLGRVEAGMKSVIGDVRDAALLRNVMARAEPQIVFHLAAQSVVRYSYESPVETVAINVVGTANLLEAVRHTASVRAVVNVTSDKCYENKEWVWGYRETDPMGGYDPYSVSKACSELVSAAFRDSYFRSDGQRRVALATARAGNVIGGGDWTPHQLIPDIIRAFLERKPVSIRSPKAIRPWQFVLEPLNGYLTLAEQLWENGQVFAEGWNFGPYDEDAKPVCWIVERLTSLWGDGASWVVDASPAPHEAHYLKLDCSKARAVLCWSPRVRLPLALDWVVEWYTGYRRQADLRALTLDQIARYEGLKAV